MRKPIFADEDVKPVSGGSKGFIVVKKNDDNPPEEYLYTELEELWQAAESIRKRPLTEDEIQTMRQRKFRQGMYREDRGLILYFEGVKHLVDPMLCGMLKEMKAGTGFACWSYDRTLAKSLSLEEAEAFLATCNLRLEHEPYVSFWIESFDASAQA